MTEKPTPEETALWQRRLASQANNRAWTLSEAISRTPEEDEEMLQAAHAAMHFWKIVGHYDKAIELVARLPDPDDRKILEATLRVLPVPSERSGAA